MAGPEEWLPPARVQKPAYSPASYYFLDRWGLIGVCPRAAAESSRFSAPCTRARTRCRRPSFPAPENTNNQQRVYRSKSRAGITRFRKHAHFDNQVAAVHVGPKLLADFLRRHQLRRNGQRLVEHGDGVLRPVFARANAARISSKQESRQQEKDSRSRVLPHVRFGGNNCITAVPNAAALFHRIAA